MKVYTRTGDAGTTALASGERVSKTDPRLVAYGTSDELNCFVGRLRALCANEEVEAQLLKIQGRLFEVGALLACAGTPFEEGPTRELEEWMDAISARLPKQPFAFVLPGSTVTNAEAHVCRAVCRRFERELLLVEGAPQAAKVYANRLSDYFFMLAKWLSFEDGKKETVWNG
jgi:cob(I)alamin adenosyltransferase